ncbi:hypothetical protein CP02DC15_0018A, partial [Chlamydia psittaci 02DC15]
MVTFLLSVFAATLAGSGATP